MHSAFGVSHPQRVSKSAPRLRKVSKSLVTGLFRGGASGAKAANRAAGGVRGVGAAMNESEKAAYRAAQAQRMRTAQVKGKEVAVRRPAGTPVSIRPKRPQLAIEGPKAGAPRNLPDIVRGPVTVPARPLERVTPKTGGGVLVPTRVTPKAPPGPSAGSLGGNSAGSAGKSNRQRRDWAGAARSAGSAAGDRLRSGASSLRGRLKSVRKPSSGAKAPRPAGQGKTIQVSPLSATLVGGGVAGGGYLAGKGIYEGLRDRKRSES